MLDTHARKHIEPLFVGSAQLLLKWGLSANQVTWLAFVIGITTGAWLVIDQVWLAVAALWLSGFLDAVDGSMARQTKTSAWGTVLDITFDRLVEISVIIGLAIRFPVAQLPLLLLSVSIIVSMTIFLTVGALSEKQGVKSFYYQAGLAERTEGFLFFTAMMVWSKYLALITMLFFIVEIFTATQRLLEARRLLKPK
ncbi:CDP-alcohol phosphatidyltransferase family protein [Mechercharimyces sp. CAU 1602]|uniref:CDP-alcohol phosphatidyltransferase family protein n=1 Tax=Mechercharimyces sp. CAU 1602 TaxID=2973933 RepID=UPI0021615E2B|nr:CDP-alcohol phosphatidyltransferase family protein [Mechercharimyces sp. CAU 1602]MCS1349984.1 CDP-alcohol phosphatidyltransferase family protein [Mechercharimyces sp. CAU 1602]